MTRYFFILGVVSLGSCAAAQNCDLPLFPNPTFEASESTSRVLFGDIDGDGDPDAVAFGSKVTRLLNNGDAWFDTLRRYDIRRATDADMLDLDGDGDLDLICSSETSDRINVLLNNGAGVFDVSYEFVTGDGPTSQVVEDFNNDGHWDIVTTSLYDDEVTVMLGTGGTSFVVHGTSGVGIEPNGSVSGDFNQDGDMDIAVINTDSDDMSILLGNGDGTFMPESRVALGEYPWRIATSDVNNDGVLDLVTVCLISEEARVFIGVGDGTFTPGAVYPIAGRSASLRMGDMDNDGNQDMVLTTYEVFDSLGPDALVKIYLGNGDGTFAPQSESFITRHDDSTVYDIDQDGNLDVVSVNRTGYTFSIHYGDGAGDVLGYERIQLPEESEPYSTLLHDFDRDGVLDVLTIGADGYIEKRAGNGDGTFGMAEVYGFPVNFRTPRDALAVDVNGDGYDDLLTASRDAVLYLNDGTGQLAYDSVIAPPGSLRDVTEIEAGDIDNDGFADLMMNDRGNRITVFSGQPDGTFVDPIVYLTPMHVECMRLLDLDADGDRDMLVQLVDNTGSDFGYMLNDGDGGFGAFTSFGFGLELGYADFGIADMDADGLIDIVLPGDREVSVFLADGPLMYSLWRTSETSLIYSMTLADIDADTDTDVIVTSNEETQLFRNFGRGGLMAPFTVASGREHRGASVGDIDLDGDPDIVLASDRDDAIDLIMSPCDLVACLADLNRDGLLNFLDVSRFIQLYTTGSLVVDFDQSSDLNFFDVTAFLAAFNAGCP